MNEYKDYNVLRGVLYSFSLMLRKYYDSISKYENQICLYIDQFNQRIQKLLQIIEYIEQQHYYNLLSQSPKWKIIISLIRKSIINYETYIQNLLQRKSCISYYSQLLENYSLIVN